MSIHPLWASLVSGLLAAFGWVFQGVRALNVRAQSWTCVECHEPNELDRDRCWNCGAGYGQDPLYPSPIPFDRRWICPSCAVWNGIARTDCWRCGGLRSDAPSIWPSGANRWLPPGNPSRAARGAPTPRTPPRGSPEDASRRRDI